ncbi:MAG: hypothetical protein FJW13_03565 [Actinobacteria bacterium]|nr:hypothetical protein [Actinomycetota bacterium]
MTRKRAAATPSIWDGLYGIVEVRRVQPYEAHKEYVCPGCHRSIPAGMGHLVCVPSEAPDLRRHWHKGCWERRVSQPHGVKRPKRS